MEKVIVYSRRAGLFFCHPPRFLTGRPEVAVGTEATGPEWVYGVVTFLGLDEKERPVL